MSGQMLFYQSQFVPLKTQKILGSLEYFNYNEQIDHDSIWFKLSLTFQHLKATQRLEIFFVVL